MKFFSFDNFMAMMTTAVVSWMSISAGYSVSPVEIGILYGIYLLCRKAIFNDQ